MSPSRHGFMQKQPSEELDRAVDFSDRLLSSTSITVDSVTAVEITNQAAGSSLEPDSANEGEDVSADLIAADPAPFVPTATKNVQFRVIGGEAGMRYKIEVVALGDDTQKAEYNVFVDVQD
jgi:hypothetical protein